MPPGPVYAFGEFRLEPGERRLLHSGRLVSLTPKAFDTLVALVERHGRLITKDDLLRLVWPDTFVEENNLAQHISSLRRALAERSPEPLIETVPRQGYRFIGTVMPEGTGIGAVTLPVPDSIRAPVEQPAAVPRPDRGRWQWAMAGTFAALVLGAVSLALVHLSTPVAPGASRYAFPVDVRPSLGGRFMTISADGKRLAYLSARGLVLQSREQGDTVDVRLSGSGPSAPFFSPDGEWIGFVDGQNLFKASVRGGPPQTIARVGSGAVASWSAHGIVFADVHGLFHIPTEGATAKPLLNPPLADTEQPAFPEMLPGGKAVLFTVLPTRTILVGASPDLPGARMEVLDLQTGRRRTLVDAGSRGHYLPSGHLVYAAGDALYAVRFDMERLEVRGTPERMVSGVANREFAVADDGTLAYLTGAAPARLSTLVWVDRQGHEDALPAPPRLYRYPRISPDGSRVALDASMPEREIWMWDLQRQRLDPFTEDPAANPMAAWSPDGRRVAFGSDRFGPTQMFIQRADRSAPAERLLEADRLQMPVSFSPGGHLLFSEDVPGHSRDLHLLWLDGSRRVQPLVQSPGTEWTAETSPDGRWFAYDSDESGQFEIYVRPFPDAGRQRWQISIDGGRQPLWSPDGRELFYRDFSGALLSVPVTLSPSFSSGPAVRILDGSNYAGDGRFLSSRTYDVARDGRRFLMLKRVEPGGDRAAIVVMLNWFEAIKRLAP